MSEFWDRERREQGTRQRWHRYLRIRQVLGGILVVGLILYLLWPWFHDFVNDRGDRRGGDSDFASTDSRPSADSDISQSTIPDSHPTRNEPSTEIHNGENAPGPEGRYREPAPIRSPPPSAASEDSPDELDKARYRYEKAFRTVDLPLLERHAARELAEIEAITERAAQDLQLRERIDAYNEATDRLHGLVPTASLRKTQLLIQQGQHRHALEGLTQLLADFPAHSAVRQAIHQTVAWPKDVWIDVALQEAESAAPDDPGYAEIWLSLASSHHADGDSLAEREAYRRGWQAIGRMTNVERAVESAIDLIDRQRATVDPLALRRRISETTELCSQVSDPVRAAEYYADLAGLARLLDDDSTYERLLKESFASASRSGTKLRDYLHHIYRCRAMSWFGRADEILEVCKDVPKYNGRIGLDPFPANAMCYGYAALAAARNSDRQAFARSMLLAEAQLACVNASEGVCPFARHLLAKADVVACNWQRAVISAENLADPTLRADILYNVVAESPQRTSVDAVPALVRESRSMRHATLAVAAYVQQSLETGDEPSDLLAWVSELEPVSLRAAAFAGLARRPQNQATKIEASPSDTLDPTVLLPEDFRSLMTRAEQSAHLVQLPIHRAFAWVQIARTWHLAGKPLSYRDACEKARSACQQEWHFIWRRRPSRRTGVSCYYYADHHHCYFDPRHRDAEAEQKAVMHICDGLVFLAERQAECGDADGAIEACLDAARMSQCQSNNVTRLFHYLRMQSLAKRIESNSGIPQSVFALDLALFPIDETYRQCLVAAWSGDLPALADAKLALENDPPRSDRANLFARVHAEYAILAAKAGRIEDYRRERRMAASLIEHQGAMPEIALLFAEADACAGEFDLSARNLSNNTMMWYGRPDRPRSALVIRLAEAGRVEEALEQCKRLSQPFWKATAIEAIAKAKATSQGESVETISTWIRRLEDPIDRVGAYCGLASISRPVKR